MRNVPLVLAVLLCFRLGAALSDPQPVPNVASIEPDTAHHLLPYYQCCRLGNQTYGHHVGDDEMRRLLLYKHHRSFPLDQLSSHQLWSMRHQYFACIMPKCGITNWLNIILHQHLDKDTFEKNYRTKQSLFNHPWLPKSALFSRQPVRAGEVMDEKREKQAIEAINDPWYFRFAITRHPWDRFVSGYRDKLIHFCQFSRKCFAQWYAKVDTSDAVMGVTPSLKEVLNVLLLQPAHTINMHFKPMSVMCEFGNIPYDFIGDLDTPAHMEYIASRIGAKALYEQHSEHSGLTETYPAFACDIETVDLARALYGRDAALLGYSFDKAYESCGMHGKSSVE